MEKDNKQARESNPDKNEKAKRNEENPAVQRGKSAIAAQRIIDPEPDDIKKAKEEKDAEQWRNEG
jgi:hypothetical protein